MSDQDGESRPRERIDGKVIRGEELILGQSKAGHMVFDCTLQGCQLVLVDPNVVRFLKVTFERCEFVPKKKVKTAWFDCSWTDCAFRGRYESTHFGILDNLQDCNPWGKYLVKGCDFSRATMHGCNFHNTDIDSTLFPKWPCFAMLHAKRNFESWKSTLYSIKNRLFWTWFADSSAALSAVVFHWPDVAESYEVDADPEEVRKKLAQLPGVRL